VANDSEPPPDPDAQQQQQVPSTGVSIAPDGITTTSPPFLGGGAGGSDTSAAGGSGSQVAITKTSASVQPPSSMSLQQDAVQGIFKSGLFTYPLQIAALQRQFSALVVNFVGGGLSVPLPSVNVTRMQLFKTANDSFVCLVLLTAFKSDRLLLVLFSRNLVMLKFLVHTLEFELRIVKQLVMFQN
jgi:hypothetical protein